MGVNLLSTLKQYFAKQIKMGGASGVGLGVKYRDSGMTRQLVRMS